MRIVARVGILTFTFRRRAESQLRLDEAALKLEALKGRKYHLDKMNPFLYQY